MKQCLYYTHTNPRRSFTCGISAIVDGILTDCTCETCKTFTRRSIMEHQDRELPANSRYRSERGADCSSKDDV